jgi:hypothetical protein
MTTQGDHRPAADVCRAHGWAAGTRLVGDEGNGPTIIEITAVGERMILAKVVTTRGVPEAWAREAVWTLECRDWRVVGMTA